MGGEVRQAEALWQRVLHALLRPRHQTIGVFVFCYQRSIGALGDTLGIDQKQPGGFHRPRRT